jgi:hypothetical protein
MKTAKQMENEQKKRRGTSKPANANHHKARKGKRPKRAGNKDSMGRPKAKAA